MRSKKSLFYLLILTLFLTFNLLSCGGGDDGFIVVAGKSELKVFVTSASGTGDLSSWTDAGGKTGLEAGDAICQAAANRAGLSGTFRAWLSDTNTDAYCHIQGLTGKKSDNCGEATLPTAAGPWFRMGDNHPFSDTIDKLINERQVFVPVYYDENNNNVTIRYFTGTEHTGILSVNNNNCADWTSNSGSDNVNMGYPLGTTQRWTALATANCVGTRRLLCMQTGSGKPLPAITAPANAKKVFITAVSYKGNFGGLDAADTICKNRAQDLGLPNHDKFKAWLSDDSINAIDRFSSDGPWYRLDGVKVADSKTDLTDGELFTSINYTGTSYIGDVVWTGTTVDGQYNSPSCANWTSEITGNGSYGISTYINQYWTEGMNHNCSFSAGLYCFED